MRRPPNKRSKPATPAFDVLRAMPETFRRHPLREYLFKRGLSLRAGAPLLGMNVTTLNSVCLQWRRPSNAKEIAEGLGFADPNDLFPVEERSPRARADVREWIERPT